MIYKKKVICDIVNKCEEINEQIKQITLSFTGHRIQKLPWGENEEDERCKKIKKILKEKIIEAIKQSKSH